MKFKHVLFLLSIVAVSLTAISAAAQPRVNVMPGNEAGVVYPYTWPGHTLTIWGNVHDGTPPYTYEWNFGDGSPTVSGSVADPKYIAASHAYATMGPKIATLTVTDAATLIDVDQVEIEVAPQAFEVEVNAAVEDGLRYLYLQQWADGRWSDYGCDDATTAMSVLAFENQGHLPINDYDEDIYSEYVKAGLDFLTSILATQSLSVQTYGDPEEMVEGNVDGNGLGVYPNYCYPGYETGMVMMAMVGSGPDSSTAPDLLAPNGPAGIVGRTYRELVVDMVDYCAWAQNEAGGGSNRGGWRYGPNYSNSDNSVSQWPTIGLEAAETNWGISAPGFVKSELELWINNSQYLGGGSMNGAFYYSPYSYARDAMPATGAGLCELAFCDIPQSDPRFQAALDYLERAWGSGYNVGFYYSMYGIAKGCRTAVDDFGNLSEVNFIGALEWSDIYDQYLVTNQNANGSWPTHTWGAYLDDAWALLVLQPNVIGLNPVAVINGPTTVPPDFAFDLDASASYHKDPARTIIEWLWDFDNSDGIDWGTPDAIGVLLSGVSYSLDPGVLADTFVVTLRVADDGDPRKTDIAEHIIIVNFDNHNPVSDAGGPYAGKIGQLIELDGSASSDPDEGTGDFIAAYAWDLDGDGEFDDCFDPICYASWPMLYSGYVGLVVTDTYGATSDTSQAYVTIWTSEVDVGLAAKDISFSESAPQPTDVITIYADISCDVDSDPIDDSITVRFYDGDPDVSVNQIGDDQIIFGMTAGEVATVQVAYTVGDTLPRHIYVRVDPQGTIDEYNEGNNEAFKEIRAVLPVAFDIKPTSCPNPLNTKKGDKNMAAKIGDGTSIIDLGADIPDDPRAPVLPVAILGTDDFDVRDIDPSTLTLMGVPALRWAYEDVTTPMPDAAEVCECTTAGADGYQDLTIKFDRNSIVAALGGGIVKSCGLVI